MPLPVSINAPNVHSSKGSDKYVPSADYHPTHIVTRCFSCKGVGIAEFKGGFNFKDGDRLMDGKPIRGECEHCKKYTELIPLTKLCKENTGEMRHLYNIQVSLIEAARRGERVPLDAIIWPEERKKAYERWRDSEANH